jgi:predicted oxidoreductase (fatty acid repression mutant protein)
MSVRESLKERRTVYALGRDLPVSIDEVKKLVTETTELVPDAFNMHSQRVILVLGEKQDELWDRIYDAFNGMVAREKIDGFKAAAGTVLYFTDESIVKGMQEQFPLYADNFPIWANQSNGMLQLSIWTGLRELGLGASLQHYNPVIDQTVKEMLNVPEHYKLIAQMPFGQIKAEPDPKAAEDISLRVQIAE